MLDPGGSVDNDDGSKDTLYGNAGSDWYMASLTIGQIDSVKALATGDAMN
jgi:hypothetical protein